MKYYRVVEVPDAVLVDPVGIKDERAPGYTMSQHGKPDEFCVGFWMERKREDMQRRVDMLNAAFEHGVEFALRNPVLVEAIRKQIEGKS